MPGKSKKLLEGYALIGNRIQVRRKLFGLGDKVLAEKVGITVCMLKRYEAGERAIPASILNDIAKELEVPFSYSWVWITLSFDSSDIFLNTKIL